MRAGSMPQTKATIFRYGPNGGVPQVWFQSPLFVGGGGFPFGPNGIRLDPDREFVYLANTTSAVDPALGTIYRLPLVNSWFSGSSFPRRRESSAEIWIPASAGMTDNPNFKP